MTEALQSWIGRTRRVADEMATPLVRRMAALTDRPDVALDRGAPVPNHWLSIMFDVAAPQSQLGPTGIRDGRFPAAGSLPAASGRAARDYHAAPRWATRWNADKIAAITPKWAVGARSSSCCAIPSRPTGVAVEDRTSPIWRPRGAPPRRRRRSGAAAAWREPGSRTRGCCSVHGVASTGTASITTRLCAGCGSYPALVVNDSVSALFRFEAALRRAPGGQVRATGARCGRCSATAPRISAPRRRMPRACAPVVRRRTRHGRAHPTKVAEMATARRHPVLDLSAVVVGPVCTHVLCEQGAESSRSTPPAATCCARWTSRASAGMNGKFLTSTRRSARHRPEEAAGIAALPGSPRRWTCSSQYPPRRAGAARRGRGRLRAAARG